MRGQRSLLLGAFGLLACVGVILLVRPKKAHPADKNDLAEHMANSVGKWGADTLPILLPESEPLDTQLYRDRMQVMIAGKETSKWPVNTPIPLPGAVLPFYRIVAFYGNFLSPRMGILGLADESEMLDRLTEQCQKWAEADPETPVWPALHYIAVTAQGTPGRDSLYRVRMPDSEIRRAINLAEKHDALVFLDIQPGRSPILREVERLKEYLKQPFVHIGLDPEYAMHFQEVPGQVIGTIDAEEINQVTAFMASIVRDHGLTPKILVVHCFKRDMITRYRQIIRRPEVQIVIHMDGFGNPAKKKDTYRYCIEKQPVQFTGFKLFFTQDTRDPKWPEVMKPSEVLALWPRPMYIQYQ